MKEISFLTDLLIVLYGTSFLFYVRDFLKKEPKFLSANLCFEIGFLIHTFLIFAEAKENEIFLPLTTMKEVMVFFSWSLAFVYVILLRRLRQESFGLILVPLLLIFLVMALLLPQAKAIPTTYFHDYYFLIHILSAFFAYASFTISFVAAVLYLIQSDLIKSKQLGSFYQRLPSLQELERFIFYSVIWGFFLLGAGIVSGVLWSKSAFQTFLVRDAKAVASVLTWCAYGLIFYLHRRSLIRGKRSVWAVLAAFGLVLFTFLGTSLLGARLHVGI